MSLKDDLSCIVGSDAVSVAADMLKNFSRDQSFEQPCKPDAVAFASTVDQVREVVRYANTTKTPLVPYSSGLNLHGACIPKAGGIIVNLSRMNRVIAVDEKNWFAVVEPGVTLQQLQEELAAKGLRAMLPFGVPPKRSALTSVLERDPALASASFEYGNDLLMDTEIVLPTGELFRTGLWSAGGRPGSHMGPVRSMIYRFWTGAQGAFGILTKACIKVEILPAMMDLHAYGFNSFEDAAVPLRDLQRREIGLECFVLNRFNLAALLSRDWAIPAAFPAQRQESPHFESLRQELPPWVLCICLTGAPELPEEKIAYEREALDEVAKKHTLALFHLNGHRAVLMEELLRPWRVLKKFHYKGSVHDLSFKAPLARVPEFQRLILHVAEAHDYPAGEIGCYILPLERGRAMHCEFDFHCDHSDVVEREAVHRLWLDASEKLIAAGAFFDRPYGDWAQLMYSRSGVYAQKLKDLKKELDPNTIMNPGRLCF
jgi:FAD/FMN-containing dehydrogenase